MYYYKIYGLSIKSEIELLDLKPEPQKKNEIEIRIGLVPNKLEGARAKGILYEAKENDFIFKFEGISAYRVQNGNCITIQPNRNSSYEEISIFLFGSVFGALLHQRGVTVLHGSSIITKGVAIIFTGHSAAGKSSLAAGLNELGYPVLTDDVSTLSYSNASQFYVHRGYPYLRLWRDVLDTFDFVGDYRRVRPQLEKFKKPILFTDLNDKYKLSALVNIHPKNSRNYHLKEIKGIDKFNLINSNTYRFQFLEGLNMTESHFKKVSLLSKLPVFQADRPSAPLQIKEFSLFIAKQIEQLIK